MPNRLSMNLLNGFARWYNMCLSAALRSRGSGGRMAAHDAGRNGQVVGMHADKASSRGSGGQPSRPGRSAGRSPLGRDIVLQPTPRSGTQPSALSDKKTKESPPHSRKILTLTLHWHSPVHFFRRFRHWSIPCPFSTTTTSCISGRSPAKAASPVPPKSSNSPAPPFPPRSTSWKACSATNSSNAAAPPWSSPKSANSSTNTPTTFSPSAANLLDVP